MTDSTLEADVARALVTERQVQHAAPRLLELPASLPVDHLSYSSVRLLRECPERWRRRYLLREYEPPSGAMIAGSAAGAAEAHNFQQKIATGVDLPEADVLDLYAAEWHATVGEQEVNWRGEKPDVLRDSGSLALASYHRTIAPAVEPTAVERQFTVRFGGCDWDFTGYLDLEESDGTVGDLKVKARRMSQADADADWQPAAYLLARRAEQQPASAFRFHVMVRCAKPSADVIETSRSDGQLDAFVQRVMSAAAEIQWRCEHDVWDGAPAGAWWCAERWCGYWDRCQWGGG